MIQVKQIGIKRIGVVDSSTLVSNINDVLDLIGTAGYYECSSLVVFEEALPEAFFDLSSRIAGDYLQKFVNYRLQVAIVGDFSKFPSSSLKDFIYESNKGSHVFFVTSEDEAIEKIVSSR